MNEVMVWKGRYVWILILLIFSVALANDFISVLLQMEGIMQMVIQNLEIIKCYRDAKNTPSRT